MSKESIEVRVGDYVVRGDGVMAWVTEVRPNACGYAFLYGTDSNGVQGMYMGTTRNVKKATEAEYEAQVAANEPGNRRPMWAPE